jgi:hypothetical protein
MVSPFGYEIQIYILIQTYILPTLYPRSGSRDISDIPSNAHVVPKLRRTLQTGGKPIDA